MVLRLFLQYAARDGETAEEKVRKRVLLPVALISLLIVLPVLIFDITAVPRAYMRLAGQGFFISCSLTLLAVVFTTKSLTRNIAVAFIVCGGMVSSLFTDLYAYGQFDTYTVAVVMMDAMLFCSCPERVLQIAQAAISVYLVIIALEQTVGIGIYESIPQEWTGYDRRLPSGRMYFVGLASTRLAVFWLDFTMTRHFAVGMQREHANMVLAVNTAHQIALALSRFNLALSDDLLSKADGLPEALRRSFECILRNLHAYEPYLPHSCLPDKCLDETLSDASTESSLLLRSPSEASISINAVPPAVVIQRDVTVLVANVKGYTKAVPPQGGQAITAFHTQYIGLVLERVIATRGLVETFLGDKVLAQYNGAKQCLTHCSQAMLCALSMSGDTLPHHTSLSIGVATGRAYCGSCGCDELRRYTMVGPVSLWCSVLERVAAAKGVKVLTDQKMVNAACWYNYRLVDIVRFMKFWDTAVELYEATGGAERSGEWMYQLEGSAVQWKEYNAALRDLYVGKLSAAAEWVKAHPDKKALLPIANPPQITELAEACASPSSLPRGVLGGAAKGAVT